MPEVSWRHENRSSRQEQAGVSGFTFEVSGFRFQVFGFSGFRFMIRGLFRPHLNFTCTGTLNLKLET